MRKIRVAQIGTSIYGHGNSIFEAMKKQPDVFEIVGYTFPENERKKLNNKTFMKDKKMQMGASCASIRANGAISRR